MSQALEIDRGPVMFKGVLGSAACFIGFAIPWTSLIPPLQVLSLLLGVTAGLLTVRSMWRNRNR
jgi:hypothetical protein